MHCAMSSATASLDERRRFPKHVIAALALALAACATPVPKAVTSQIVPQTFDGPVEGSAQIWPNQDWWRDFGSPELSGLIAAAQADNRDLAAAAARVMEAQAQVTIQRAALFPQFSLQAQGQRSATRGASALGGAQATAGQTSSTGNAFGLGLGASYEVDVWGFARNNLRSADETFKAARFAQQAAALIVTANVANVYFSVLILRERIAIANEDIAAINGILETIKLKVSTGKSSHLDLAQEQAQVESVEAQLPLLEEQELEARVALAVLLGRAPEGFAVIAQTAAAIRPPTVAPGLASDLLRRRPDVAQAEANLTNAHANLDAARAAFLPQVTLTGNGGYASTTIDALLHGPSFA